MGTLISHKAFSDYDCDQFDFDQYNGDAYVIA